MEARDKLSVIISWLDDFKPMNPKRVEQIIEYIRELFEDWGKLGGKNIRLEDEIKEKDAEIEDMKDRIEELECLLEIERGHKSDSKF